MAVKQCAGTGGCTACACLTVVGEQLCARIPAHARGTGLLLHHPEKDIHSCPAPQILYQGVHLLPLQMAPGAHWAEQSAAGQAVQGGGAMGVLVEP